MQQRRLTLAFSRTKMTTLSSVLAALAFASAHAADASTSPRTGPIDRAQAAAEARRAQAGPAASGGIDNTPARLTAFSLTGSVDTSQPEAAAYVDLTVKDDLSGVQSVILTLRSPSGVQTVVRDDVLNSGVRTYSGHFAVGAQAFSQPGLYFSRFSEAGTWTADSLFVADVAGNVTYYTASDLAAIGPSTVTVVNNGPWDAIPPILISGEFTPKTLSLSAPARGTTPGQGIAPMIAGAVRGFDPGNGVSSGMYYVAVEFCLPDHHGGCTDGFEIQGVADGPDLADATVRVSGSPRKDMVPGKYFVDMVTLTDMAGNSQNITSGLSTYFTHGMSLTITP
jgi:hypothetical protein